MPKKQLFLCSKGSSCEQNFCTHRTPHEETSGEMYKTKLKTKHMNCTETHMCPYKPKKVKCLATMGIELIAMQDAQAKFGKKFQHMKAQRVKSNKRLGYTHVIKEMSLGPKRKTYYMEECALTEQRIPE
jgi:hypothetical protein